MQTTTVAWLRPTLVASVLALLLSGSFWLAPRPHLPGKAGLLAGRPWLEEEEEEEENDGDRVYGDRPDLAWEQEAALTRDPTTGRVPRERLLAAARYNQTALAARAQQRTTAATLDAATWTERGPSNVGGRLLALLVDPADATGNTVWAGSAGGGLWKLTGGTGSSYTWASASSGLRNLAVATVAAVPDTSPEVLYCGTGEGYYNADAVQGAGIWKSSNGGATWAQLPSTNNANFYFVQKIVVQPVTKDVYAATRAGLWRSQDAGNTWSPVLSLSSSPATLTNRVADVEIGADNTVYAAFGIFSTDGIYRSATGNAGSWTKLNTLAGSGLPTTGYQRIELACAPSDASRVYALFQSGATGYPVLNIYRSVNGGTSWTLMSNPGSGAAAGTGVGQASYDFTRGQAWYDLAASVSPADPNTLYVGGIDLWMTNNGDTDTPSNVTWVKKTDWTLSTSSSSYAHSDQHAIAFVPTATAPANRAYFGNDGGVAYSSDASINNATEPMFSFRNNGLNVTQFYATAMHPTNFTYFLAGAQDNGSQKFTAAGLNATTAASGGDGGFCAIDQLTPAVQFTSYVYNQYYRSLNGGATAFTSFALSSTTGSFINPFDYDSQSKVLYAGYAASQYLAWTNASTATSRTAATLLYPSLGTGAGTVTHITASPSVANRIYVGTNAGKLLRVDNANTATPTVATLYTGGSTTSVSCVALDPASATEDHLLLTYSNYGIVSVFETTNATAATPTWISVEGALPDMPVRWALFDPTKPTRALLATEMGVYSTEQLSGSTTTWVPTTNGPLNVRVDMLRYRAGDKLVAAATHGRGLFTAPVFDPAPLPVQLVSFTGALATGGIALHWQTASEQHSSYFELERSTNAVDFGRLTRTAAAGNSITLRNYGYLDATVGTGLYYYRLRSVDLDGSAAYSPVVAVRMPDTTGPLLASTYPNPFGPTLNLTLGQLPAGEVSIQLLDALGRQVLASRQHPTTGTLALTVPDAVAPGTYLLSVSADGQHSTRRVVKQ